MNFKNNTVCDRSLTHTFTYHIIKLIENYRELKLIYSDKKQISAYLGPGVDGGLTAKGHNGSFGHDRMFCILNIGMAT